MKHSLLLYYHLLIIILFFIQTTVNLLLLYPVYLSTIVFHHSFQITFPDSSHAMPPHQPILSLNEMLCFYITVCLSKCNISFTTFPLSHSIYDSSFKTPTQLSSPQINLPISPWKLGFYPESSLFFGHTFNINQNSTLHFILCNNLLTCSPHKS